jgi:pyridoxal phosphate enzyme (YggS family)
VINVAANLRAVKERIARVCEAAGRDPASVTLVAVTKTHLPETVRAALEAGHRDFGENYVQELRDKAAALPTDLRWHYIGGLQTNKVKYLAPWIHLIHTVDSEHLAAEIEKRAAQAGRVVHVLAQINVAGEAQKGGCEPAEAPALLAAIGKMAHLELRGLMTMPPFWEAERVRPFFAELRRLRDRLQDQLGRALPELSMGMSADFEVAIQEGATLVRVGTAIFGAR